MSSTCCDHIFHRPVCFTALLSVTVIAYFGVQGAFSTGILTTLQRDFKLKSSEIGFMITVNDILGLIFVTPLAYFGAKRHRPRILGTLTLLYALGCFVCAIPHFIGGGGSDGPTVYNDTIPPQDVQLCLVGRDDGGNRTDDECSAEEHAASGAQYNRAFWLYIGQAICGIAGAGYFPLGTTYIDDGVSQESSSLHVATLFMMGSLAPVFAFGVSALVLSYHTDFDKIDVDELGYDDSDPRWIGAWWLGYIIFSCIFVVISIPFFLFPKVWPHNVENHEDIQVLNLRVKGDSSSKVCIIEDTRHEQGISVSETIKGYFFAVTRLLTNITYLSCMVAVCAELATLAGFSSFVGRYIETVYDVTPSITSIILGSVTSPTAFFGNLFGGLLVKKMRLMTRGLAGIATVISLVVLLVTPLNFSVGCSSRPIAGVNVPYPGEDRLDATPTCVSDCECPSGIYTPVCGPDGITYLTPCHVGCTKFTEGTKLNASDATISYLYSGCSCITSNRTLDETFDELTATQEACPRDNLGKLIGFIIIFGVTALINSMIKNPSFMLQLRCVNNQDRAISLGVGSLLTRIFGFVTAPVYFGAAIQTTCLMFQESCGKTGNCLIYDSDSLRNVMFGLVLFLKFVSLSSFFISFVSIRQDETGTYRHTQLCASTTSSH